MDVSGLNYKTAKGLMKFEERLTAAIEGMSSKNHVRINSSKKQLNTRWSSDSGNCIRAPAFTFLKATILENSEI
jgi:hypothetical protein